MAKASTKAKPQQRMKGRPARRVRGAAPAREAHGSARVGDSTRDKELQAFLDRFARDLTAGRTQEVVPQWGIPGLIIGDEDLRAVSSLEEVEAFFAGAKEQYNARGITDTRANIRRVEWATDRIAIVHVRWPYLDDQGNEMGHEESSYVLKRDGDRYKFHVAVLRGASTG